MDPHRRLDAPLAPLLLSVCFALLFQGCLLLEIRPTGEGIGVRAKDLPEISTLDGDKVYSLLGPDRISAIDAPRMVAAGEADFMADEELVLGVTDGGETRAYSLWHLDRHEIVNDELGGDPIAATW